MNRLGAALVLCSFFYGVVSAAPPAIMRDLARPAIRGLTTRVENLPPSLRSALAHTFAQKKLYLGNPNQPLGGELAVAGKPDFPERRLVFAFESPNYYAVYVEYGPPAVHASILVFDKSKRKSPRLVWGAVDLHRPFAATRDEILRRIARGTLREEPGIIW